VTTLVVSKMNKKSCVLCGNFISIYKINRTLHGRLGIRILSSRAKSISHSKIEFVSPRGHVISSIYYIVQYIILGIEGIYKGKLSYPGVVCKQALLIHGKIRVVSKCSESLQAKQIGENETLRRCQDFVKLVA